MSVVKPRRFGDKYLLLDRIGAGGVAEVFRGKLTRDKGFEKLIVIKKLLAEHNSDREMVDIFIREARLAALLQHDNIAATYDFGEIDGEYFLAMEYLFGKNLHSVMVRAREHGELFGLGEALVIGSKICEGMEYAHNLNDLQHRPLNIVHRDLTPHNIFITYDGKVKILDFGVAKAELFDNKTREGVVKGKISYMSPERLSGEDVDSRSDIFSIGILLYEMVSRRRMYQGDTAELIRKCLTAEYDNLKAILPELDPALHHILDKALAVEVERRYQSCAQMQSDIDELLFQMQQRGGYRLLKGSIRGLFAEEYETEHKQVGDVLRIDGEGEYQRDKTNISIDRQGRLREGRNSEDKTAMLLHRPPSHFIKLYWSRAKQWLLETYLLIRETPDRRRVAIPFVVAGAALMLLVLILFIRTSPDQQDEVTPSSVVQEAVQKPVQEEVRPAAEMAERQEIVEEKVDSETLVDALKGQKPESAAETLERQEIVEEKVDSETLAGAVKGQEPESAVPKAQESEPNETAQSVPDSFTPAAEEPPPAQNLVVKSNKVPVLKKQELKKKKNLSEITQSVGTAPVRAQGEASGSPGSISPQASQVDVGPRTLSFEAQAEDLAKQKQLSSLHAKAREAMRQGRLIQPEGQSAQAYFNEILFLAPDDNVAIKGLTLICEKYSQLAEESLADKEFGRAEEYTADGLSVIPNYRRLIEVRNRIERERKEHIFELSEKARLCLEANKLSTPANDSAYFYYQEIARLEPDNALVRKGYKDIADGYAKMADEAFRGFDYKAAEVYVERGLQVIPDHYYLLSLKEELGRSDLGRVGHSMKKKLNRFLSE